MSIAGSILLSACGGGGGGSEGSPTSPVATGPGSTASHTVGGTLAGLASQGELKIALNGGTPLVLTASGAFRFPAALPSGSHYAVTIDTQPVGQSCTIASGSGVLTADVGNVAISCVVTPPTVILATISGSIEGMAPGTNLTLVNNGEEPRTYGASGSFSFTNVEGTAYALSVARQPAGQWCKVIGGAGIATAATTPVTVNCRKAQLALWAGSGGGPGSADGVGTNARFTRPMGAALDSGGNLFVADMGNHVIRKISPAGVVTTFAGAAKQFASVDGVGEQARFGSPTGIVADRDDNLYVTDAWFNTVRKITPAGQVTTLYAPPATGGQDESRLSGQFNLPTAIVRDGAGNLYIASSAGHVIRKLAPNGAVSTYAGTDGVCGHADGAPGVGTLCLPTGLALDAAGNLVVIDAGYQLLRRIAPDGTLSTMAGTAGQFGGRDGPGASALFAFAKYLEDYSLPLAGIVAEPSGSVLVNDYYNGRLRRIAPNGDVTTVASLGEGYVDGAAASARLRYPTGLARGADGDIYLAEDSHAIRKLASGQVSTFAGRPRIGDQVDATGTAAHFNGVFGLAADAAGNLFVADHNNHAIRKVSPAGAVTTFAGRPDRSVKVEASPAPDNIVNPNSIAIDRAGNLYVVDRSCVRKILPDGKVTILAGAFTEPGHADGPGSEARFFMPRGIAVDDKGNVFVGDTGRLRKITPDGMVSTLTTPSCGNYNEGPEKRICTITGVAVDRGGNVYFSDSLVNNVRRLAPDGVMTTVAGNTVANIAPRGSADGRGAAAQFSHPGALALDSAGNLYVSDEGNYTVRVITPAGVVSTLVGLPGRGEVHEGPLPGMLAEAATLTIGPDDRLYIGSANSVLTVEVK